MHVSFSIGLCSGVKSIHEVLQTFVIEFYQITHNVIAMYTLQSGQGLLRNHCNSLNCVNLFLGAAAGSPYIIFISTSGM